MSASRVASTSDQGRGRRSDQQLRHGPHDLIQLAQRDAGSSPSSGTYEMAGNEPVYLAEAGPFWFRGYTGGTSARPTPWTPGETGGKVRRRRPRDEGMKPWSGSAFMTPRDVAAEAGLSYDAVRRAIASGELKAAKVRRRIVIRRGWFDAWIDAHVLASATTTIRPPDDGARRPRRTDAARRRPDRRRRARLRPRLGAGRSSIGAGRREATESDGWRQA